MAGTWDIDEPGSDRKLVASLLNGEEVAFQTFFVTYFQRLFRFALRRVNDEASAEDIAQATLVRAIKKLATWRGEAALFTWLCTLCRHEVAAYWERTSRRPMLKSADDDPQVRAELESLAAAVELPDARLERRELSDLVQLTLDYLPGRYGDVLEWKYLEGLSTAEIAARLDSTPKAAESLLSRAREAFRGGFVTVARSER